MQMLSMANHQLLATVSDQPGAHISPLCLASLAAEAGCLEAFLLPAAAISDDCSDITEMVVLDQFTRWKLDVCASLTGSINDVSQSLRELIMRESCPKNCLRVVRQLTPSQIEQLPPTTRGLVRELRRRADARIRLIAAGCPPPRRYGS